MNERIITIEMLKAELAHYSMFAWGCYLAMKHAPDRNDREFLGTFWSRLDDKSKKLITKIREQEGATPGPDA